MYGPIQSLNSKTALAQMFVKVKVTVDVTSTPSLNLTDITCSPFFESNMALLSMRSLGACLPSSLLLLLPEEKKERKKKVCYLVWQNILCCVHNTVVQFKMVSVHPETIFAPPHLLKVPLTLPLKQFNVCVTYDGRFSLFQRRLSSTSSFAPYPFFPLHTVSHSYF